MIDTPVAEIFLLGIKGAFVAEDVETATNFVRARGRFRRRYGSAGAPTYSWGPLVERHWPWHRIDEVRHVKDLAA